MKLKDGLILRKIAGQDIIVPTGRLSQVAPMVKLTPSAAYLWEFMDGKEFTEDSLTEEILNHYSGVTEEVVRRDIRGYLKLLDDSYLIEGGKPEPMRGRVKIRLPENWKPGEKGGDEGYAVK